MLQQFNPQNMGAFFQQAGANPFVRGMAKIMTGLNGENLDKLFQDAPVMLSSIQGSVMGTATQPAVKTILEQESVQAILTHNPKVAAAIQEMTTEVSKTSAVIEAAVQPVEEPQTVNDAEEQD